MNHRLELPHGPICWTEIGAKSAGYTVLLLHGFPHDRHLWDAQVEAHATAFPGARLLIPDLPGFGSSAPLPEPGIDGYADSVASVLDAAAAERAVVVGLSMGGYVAFAFWRRHADRVQALVLADTKSTTDSESAREKRQQLIVDAERSANAHTLTDAMVPGQLGETTRSTHPEVVARAQAMLHRATPRAIADGSRAMLARHDSTDTLATITVPVLVLVGDEDTLTPLSDAIAMASGIARSRLVTVPGAGHLAPLEQPTIVNAAIAEFLEVSEISAA
jgi:pimeloyl-ACP methyl ester carboxylesterase